MAWATRALTSATVHLGPLTGARQGPIGVVELCNRLLNPADAAAALHGTRNPESMGSRSTSLAVAPRAALKGITKIGSALIHGILKKLKAGAHPDPTGVWTAIFAAPGMAALRALCGVSSARCAPLQDAASQMVRQQIIKRSQLGDKAVVIQLLSLLTPLDEVPPAHILHLCGEQH
jgi:hypothetical protein